MIRRVVIEFVLLKKGIYSETKKTDIQKYKDK